MPPEIGFRGHFDIFWEIKNSSRRTAGGRLIAEFYFSKRKLFRIKKEQYRIKAILLFFIGRCNVPEGFFMNTRFYRAFFCYCLLFNEVKL